MSTSQSQPEQPVVTSAPNKPHRGAMFWLPWILVAFLTGAVVWLGAWQVQTLKELESVKKTGSAATATPGAGGSPAATAQAITALPRDGQNAAAVKQVLRRQADDPRALGNIDAPNTLIEWADYRCPFCAKWALETLPQFKPLLDSGQLRIEFHDLVLFGDESMLAHRAGRAAGMQGKYWEYATAIWQIHTGQGHPAFNQQIAESLAAKAGVPDIAKFKADLANPELTKQVEAESTKAQRLGISGTPFFLVNTTPMNGALPTEQFLDLLAQYGAKK